MSSYFGLIEEIMVPCILLAVNFLSKRLYIEIRYKNACPEISSTHFVEPKNADFFLSPSFLTQFHLVLFNFSRLVHRVIYIK